MVYKYRYLYFFMNFDTGNTSDRIAQIHPLNANYLLDTEPYRLYGDMGGNLLEIVVERFASTVVETLYGHGGIIGIWYHDATTDGEISFENAYVLKRDGRIWAFHSQYGLLPVGIDLNIFYMLLNPVEMNNWYVQDPKMVEKDWESFARSWLGISLPSTTLGITGVKWSIAHMRERYLRTIRSK